MTSLHNIDTRPNLRDKSSLSNRNRISLMSTFGHSNYDF